MKLHYVPHWVCTKPDRRPVVVYTQKTAIDKLAEGFDIRLPPQDECMRVCVKDRQGEDRSDTCYMCDREAMLMN